MSWSHSYLTHCLKSFSLQILVTSNDSRIRLYDLRDLSLSMKYKGYVNSSSQIKASFRWEESYDTVWYWKHFVSHKEISDIFNGLTILLRFTHLQCFFIRSFFDAIFFSCSHDYSFIVSGSEDKYVYIWSTYHDLSKFTSVRRDRNDFWEGIKGNSTWSK